MDKNLFLEKGWLKFPFDPNLARWVKYAFPHARKIIAAPQNQQWLRCGGTWFAGVNLLNNNANGTIENGPVLAGEFVDFIQEGLGFENIRWDAGQISVCYPGYPQPMAGESKAAFNYRLNRDAAHVDGLLPEGPQRRRHLREHHAFILGIALSEFSQNDSPLVIWEGSHEIIRSAFKSAYADLLPESWREVDVTNLYQNTRRQIFESCKRVKVSAKPGECYLIHRLALHGVCAWENTATTSVDGRMICYFRPDISSPEEWLNQS